MSYISKVLLCAYAVTALSYNAAADTVVVAPPSASSYGTLRVNGEVSKDPLYRTFTNKKGQKKVEAEILTAQPLSFSACLFERNANGSGKRGSMQECDFYSLNETIKLPVGSYMLFYSDTIAVAEIRSGEDKVINLSKIQAPKVAGKIIVHLFIDYKSEREQNKFLFWSRLNMSQDFYTSLQAEYWGRNLYKPYVDSGNYELLPPTGRESFFSATGDFCEVDNKGAASNCLPQRVGVYSEVNDRQNCKVKTTNGFSVFGGFYSYNDDDCKKTRVVYDQSRAYFLVFPGVYTMKWNDSYYISGDDAVLTKSGIVVN